MGHSRVRGYHAGVLRSTSALQAAVAGASRVDPLAALDDDFSTDTGKWSSILAGGTTMTPVVSGGELDLTISAGGTGGSFAFDGNDYCYRYQTITGTSWVVMARVRARNTANTGIPPATLFRLFALHVADPANVLPVYNFIHVAIGTVNGVQSRVEWKTNDHDGGGSNDVSAFNSIASPSGNCDVDLRIVRSGQSFVLGARASTGDMLTATDWTTVATIDRTSNATPPRAANGAVANLAVPLPTTLRVGFVPYASTNPHDVRGFVTEFRARTI